MSMSYTGFTAHGLSLTEIVDTDILHKLAEEGIVDCQFSFDGDAVAWRDCGALDWSTYEHYNDDVIYYVDLPRYPAPFGASYPDMDALVDDLYNEYNRTRDLAEEKCDIALPILTREKVRDNLRTFHGAFFS